MTDFKIIRYFVPTGSDTFAKGWYEVDTNGERVDGVRDVSDQIYAGPNRLIIDAATPATESGRVLTGGGDDDEILIKSDASVVTIHDTIGSNVIVFDVDVIITSIEASTVEIVLGTEIKQYVITLDSGNAITVRITPTTTFQHLGDRTKADPLTDEEFIAAYGERDDGQGTNINGFTPTDKFAPAPATGSDLDGTIAEDAADPTVTGTLTVEDDDGTTPVITAPSNLVGTYGSIAWVEGSSTDTGTWTYTLDNNGPETQALAQGQTATETFTFTVADTGGTEPVQIDVVITVTGANDAPAIAMVDDGAGTLVPASIDDQTGTVGDEITEIDLNGLFADVDTGDTFTLEVMVLASDGSKSGLDTLGLVYSDSTGLITGTIDGGVVPGTFTIEVVATDAQSAASEAYTFTIGVAAMLVRPTATPETGITIDEDTSYAFPAGNDTLTALFGFADVSNSNGSPGDFTGVYIELASIDDGRLRLDDGTEVVSTTDLSGSDGAPVIDGYIYVTFSQLSNLNLVPAVDFNGNLTLSYRVWDGEASSEEDAVLTITVDPVNDVPVVESGNEIGEQTGRVGQDIDAIDLSSLFTDVDGDTVDLTVMVIIASARVELDATLGLTYDPVENEITGTIRSDVSAGTYTIEVIATDGSGDASEPSTFTIVVAPDNAPEIGGSMDGSIDEDAADPTVTGTLTITDADNDAVPTVELPDGAGDYGTLTFVASADGGTWTYTLDNTNAAVQALGVGDTLTEEFTFTADGAEDFVVTITINGVNEAPELVSGMEIEDQNGNVGQPIDPISESDLRALFADADTDNAALVLTVMVMASDGTRSGLDTIGLGYNSTDGIIGTPNAPGTYTIEVTASDGDASTANAVFTFDIVVVHPPVIGNDSPTEIGEDAASPITGTLTITDQDSSSPFLPIAITDDSDGTDDGIVMGDYGTLTFDSGTGGWSYMVDERAQALNDTPGTDTFVFTSEGATDFELVITVTGANDDPAIAQVDDGSGTGTLVAASIDDQSGTEGEDTVIDLSGVFIDPDDVLDLVPTATDSGGTAVVFDGTTNSFSYDSDTGDAHHHTGCCWRLHGHGDGE